MVWIMLAVSILTAAVSVRSLMPFLAVLSDPSRIETTPVLVLAYEALEYTSVFGFLLALGFGAFVVNFLWSLAQIAKTWTVAWFLIMLIHSISSRPLAVLSRAAICIFPQPTLGGNGSLDFNGD